uniref:START domain-containing protein n=1 Tax=Ornithorhynchus anatinus TaxID=9258 RepID=A0A6I8MXR0_ORNAN
MDLDYRRQWDEYVKELREQECEGKKIVYWEVKYPFPMSNRDVSFGQNIAIPLGQDSWTVASLSECGAVRGAF